MILSIETSTRVCSVALHREGILVADQTYHLAQSHSSLLPAIADHLLTSVGEDKRSLLAIAVSDGPGSYTGLRIGTSTAKGIAFALDLPLLAIDTLETMIQPFLGLVGEEARLIPMLDARRMEVYRAVFDSEGVCMLPAEAHVLGGNSLAPFADKELWLVGNGSGKVRQVDGLKKGKLRILETVFPEARNMGSLAFRKYEKSEYEDLDTYEPFYMKSFQAKQPKDQLRV